MSGELTVQFAPCIEPPGKQVRLVLPNRLPRGCESYLRIGLFFDGTYNNKEKDEPRLAQSNVARLWHAYREDHSQGFYRVYIPGVGTPFPEIGEQGENPFGGAFGIGCEQRVLYGLLAVFNCMHQFGHRDEHFFSKKEMATLCANDLQSQVDNIKALFSPGMSRRAQSLCGNRRRTEYLQMEARKLQHALVPGRPIITEIFLDVFGFSRGAAQARVFCQWLAQLLTDGELAGVKVHLPFLGLFDTVASAGILSGLGSALRADTAGHDGWAAAEHLRIHPMTENCVHMVAMHELRRNFPLDSITVAGVLPPHCQEYAYPGSHSDVGGGYAPGELGIASSMQTAEGDARKLSQIALNHMLKCANRAGVPVSTANVVAQGQGLDPFAVSPQTAQAYTQFLDASGLGPRQLCEGLLPYLAWRWQNRLTFTSPQQFRDAPSDKSLLADGNAQLLMDASTILESGELNLSYGFLSTFRRSVRRHINGAAFQQAATEMGKLDPEAPAVLDMARSASAIAAPIARFFDHHVHDSLAGFRKTWVEPTGYWRFRKGFQGSDQAVIAAKSPDAAGERRPA